MFCIRKCALWEKVKVEIRFKVRFLQDLKNCRHFSVKGKSFLTVIQILFLLTWVKNYPGRCALKKGERKVFPCKAVCYGHKYFKIIHLTSSNCIS